MLINPNYKAGGGSPTPSSGYVEDKLLYLYDGTAEKLTYGNNFDLGYDGTAIVTAPHITAVGGWTAEAYATVAGVGDETYQRALCFANRDTSSSDINIAFGTVSGLQSADYIFNPMLRWGANLDYEVPEIASLTFGTKHTFAIVSIPDPEGIADNTVKFYVDGANVGTDSSQRKSAEIVLSALGIENGINVTRPLNGTLHSGRFYTRALTAAELAANHANDVAKYGGNG